MAHASPLGNPHASPHGGPNATAADDGYSSSADINATLLWITGILGTLVVVVIVLFSLGAFQAVMNKEHERKVLSQPNVVDALKAEQAAAIADTIGPAIQQVAAAYAAEAPQEGAPEGAPEGTTETNPAATPKGPQDQRRGLGPAR